MSVVELKEYVFRQLNHFFPDNRMSPNDQLFIHSLNHALERSEYCFKHIALKSFHNKGTTYFSHLHADQYTIFLWFLSNTVWKEYQDIEIASKLFYLNKTLNGVVCMYDAGLPDIFLIVHGGGIVLGKAKYQDFFVCYQGCTVGAIEGVYPVIGRGVAMAPQSSIIGECVVGDFSTIGNQSLLRNRNLNERSIYIRNTDTGSHDVRQSQMPWAQSFFNVPIHDNGEEK